MATQPATAVNDRSLQTMQGLLSVKQAATMLGISPKTVRDHVLHRRIEFVKIGGRVLFRPEKIMELIERCTVPARVPPAPADVAEPERPGYNKRALTRKRVA